MKLVSYLKVAFATTFNIILNALTLGRYVWLEGRVRKGVFRNWARRFRYSPKNFVQPATEAEIVELVKNSKSLRVFGSAHSFNSGVVVDDTLVSLDRYSGVIWKDLQKKQLAVRAGTRVRDVVKALLDERLAFAAQPSHDAQSIAGILSTDVHGTGKNWGFVSESVVKLKLLDGRGEIFECGPTDDLFRAAIGGVGAVGIILEVVVQGVDRFNVEQKTEISELKREPILYRKAARPLIVRSTICIRNWSSPYTSRIPLMPADGSSSFMKRCIPGGYLTHFSRCVSHRRVMIGP